MDKTSHVCNHTGDISGASVSPEVSDMRSICTTRDAIEKFQVPLRLATLNVRGLSARKRQYQVNRLLLENDLHIAALQETKIETEEQTDRMVGVFRTRYNVCVCHAVGTSGGCALLLRNDLGIEEVNVIASEEGRLFVVDFLL